MKAIAVITGIVFLAQTIIAESEHGYGGVPDNHESQECYGKNEVFGCVSPRLGCTDSCDDRIRNLTSCKNVRFLSNAKDPNSIRHFCPSMNCQCKKNFARDPDSSECVPITKCPVNIKCEQNEFYSTCKSSCYSDSCEAKDLLLQESTCDKECDVAIGAGCQCEIGYGRHPLTKKCVKRNECK